MKKLISITKVSWLSFRAIVFAVSALLLCQVAAATGVDDNLLEELRQGLKKPDVSPEPAKKHKKAVKSVIKQKQHSSKKTRTEKSAPVIKTPASPATEESASVVETPASPATDVIKPEMVAIKGGCFQIGSPTTEPEHQDDEKQHQVCVENFAIGKYEVTQAQWQAVMGNNPSYFKGENLPVENVSWDEVQSFIAKLNAKTSKTYRLPTEAQWEYAARAGTMTPFYTGNCINTHQANYNGNYDYNNCGAKTGVYKEQTVAVGSYSANGYGLHDVAGNVWEWTCSDYVKDYDGSETKCSGGVGTLRAIRGGSWSSIPYWLRSATRGYNAPSNRGYNLGLRLSRM